MSQPRVVTADGRRDFACFPAAILAFVVNDRDEILMLSHPERKGGWEVVNGAIEEGESPVEALLREVAEEAGPEVDIQPVATVHAFLYRYDAAVPAMLSIAYAAHYRGGRVSPGSDMSMSEHRWIGIDQIESSQVTLLAPTQPWLFRRAIAVCHLFRDDQVDLEPWVPSIPFNPLRGDRVLSAIVFIDFVASTLSTVQLGDKRWVDLLEQHDRVARRVIDQQGGRIVKHTGDGLLALFSSAAAAVAATTILRTEAASLGIGVRAGVHVGEHELTPHDVAGQAVIAASRLCDLAGPGEVLLSSIAAALLTGSDVPIGEPRLVTLKGLGEQDVFPLLS